MTRTSSNGFRQRLIDSTEPLFGTFIKTPSPHATEILGGLGFDFVIIDAEHAPFDRTATELILLAARAAGMPALVRIAACDPHRVLAALDDGAAGILAPHIDSVERAEALVAASRYARRRGFSNSPRAGGYGARSLWEHVDASDREVAVVAMIEDPDAVEDIEAIVAVEGIDAVFIGRADLTVAFNDRKPGAPQVQQATQRVIAAARRAGKAVSLLAANAEEAAEFSAVGVRAFVISSDQGFMRSAASQALAAFKGACGPNPHES